MTHAAEQSILHPTLSRRAQAWSPAWYYNHVEELGVVFCAIPKNACRTLKRFFSGAVGRPIPPEDFHPGTHHELAARWSFSNLPRARRDELLGSCRTVVFLRDPLLRVASAFTDRVVRIPRPEQNAPMYADVWRHEGLPGEPDPGVGVTFEQFVRHLARTPCDGLEQHWKPQACFTLDHRFDFVGDVSRVVPDLDRLARFLGVEPSQEPARPQTADNPGVPGEHARTPSGLLRASALLPGAASLYTPELTDLVRARYAEDFELMTRLDASRAA